MLGALNAYDKNLLHEYHYRFFKCFESAQRTTDGEFCVPLSERRMTYLEILAQKFNWGYFRLKLSPTFSHCP